MPYTFDCDGWCGKSYDEHPMLMGEFNERQFKTTPEGGHLADADFEPGDVVTLCPTCTVQLLLET